MKLSRLFITAILLVSFQFSLGQVPQGLTFQAIARDVSGNPITGQSLTVETGILSDTIINTYIWKETHPVTTNQFGLFTLIIGTGTKTGGSAGSFNAINWSAGPLFIRTRVLYQSIWRDMSAAKLWSVPYAMVADKALAVTGDPVMINGGAVYIMNNVGIGTDAPGTTKLAVVGDDSQSSDALFEVKRKDGNVIFAVYNHGVRVNVPVDTLTKAKKGGFAVGGFDDTKGVVHDYMVISPDSIRLYFDNAVGTKAKKGGFAVGGFDDTKATVREFMVVNSDSIRLYIDNADGAKAKKGGFAVGGFDGAKGINSINFIQLYRDNYFIGHNSGANLTTGLYNSTVGYESGMNIMEGGNNAFMGYQAGYNNTTGSSNLFLGYKTGFSNIVGSNNSFVGFKAGYSNSDGLNNSFLGSSSGQLNTTGSFNTFVGDSSGYNNTTGTNNSFIGTKAGFSNITGGSNSFIGNFTGYSNRYGSENVYIGNYSGFSTLDTYGNVFIGTKAGYNIVNGWDNVLIGTESGNNNIDGAGNVFLGYKSGRNNLHGTRNIFIGNMAGFNQQGSNRLIISNHGGDSTSVLIWGDLEANQLRLNGNIGIGTDAGTDNLSILNNWGRAMLKISGTGDTYDYSAITLESKQTVLTKYVLTHNNSNQFSIVYHNGTDWIPGFKIDSLGKMSVATWDKPTQTMDINGNIRVRGVTSGSPFAQLYITSDGVLTTLTSDQDTKTNIAELDGALAKVMDMRGIYFSMKGTQVNDRKIGFLAQEMETILPEVVFINPVDGYKGINYAEITVVLTEAIKEQQRIIDDLSSRLAAIETLLEK